METEQSEYDSEFYTRKREHIIRDWEAAWTTLGLGQTGSGLGGQVLN